MRTLKALQSLIFKIPKDGDSINSVPPTFTVFLSSRVRVLLHQVRKAHVLLYFSRNLRLLFYLCISSHGSDVAVSGN